MSCEAKYLWDRNSTVPSGLGIDRRRIPPLKRWAMVGCPCGTVLPGEYSSMLALTLTLSPGEREQRADVLGSSETRSGDAVNWLFRARGGGIAGRLVNASSRRTVHPLPGGEGGGEGERFTRKDQSSRGLSTVLKE